MRDLTRGCSAVLLAFRKGGSDDTSQGRSRGERGLDGA